LKKDFPEDQFEIDTDDKDIGDSVDIYNEERARKEVKSLLDGDEAAESAPRGPRDAYGDRDGRGGDVRTPADKSSHPRPRTTPAPRPAIKAGTPPDTRRSPQTRAQRTRPVVPRTEYDDYDEFDDEDLDVFRARKKQDVPQEPRRSSASARSRADRVYESDRGRYDDEQASPMRWIAAAIIFVGLIVLVFLVYRITVLSGELKDAQEALEKAPASEADVTEMRFLIDEQKDQIKTMDDEIERLRALLLNGPADPAPYTPIDPGITPPDTQPDVTAPPPAATITLPAVYTVVEKDNLSKISEMFYGSASQANIDKIMRANNLSSDVIGIGQKLTIPE
jgi:hypothetical protein